ncbi:MAG: ROK family protein, partial [Anaerolineales bacterium]
HNRILVLRTIFDHDSISRADIARATRLTRTTVSDIITALLEEGLVNEVGIGESQGGKSPILLSLAENSRYLIGLDLAHSEFRAAIVNLRGKICTSVTKKVNDLNGEEALALVFETLDELLLADYQPLVGIGVGTPGLVDSKAGIVLNAVNLDWVNLPLAKLLRDRYQLPIHLLNDSHAAAIGEYTYGEGHLSESNVVVINARHGLGAGIMIKGQLFQGDGGGAGEIGHIVVQHAGGLHCRCGNYGCLETIASVKALLQKVQEQARLANNSLIGQTAQVSDLNMVSQAFADGDPVVREIVLESAFYMGLAISTLIGTLNIQKIVISGDMAIFGEPWIAAIRETFTHNTLPRLAENTQIEIGQLGKDGVLLGASAVLAKDYSSLFLQH